MSGKIMICQIRTHYKLSKMKLNLNNAITRKNMRKIFSLIILSIIIFTSCTQSEMDEISDKPLVFEFSAVNTIQTGSLRAGLYGPEPVHKVSRVAVYVFKDNGSGDFLYTKTFDQIQWPAVGASYYSYTVPKEESLQPGNYKLIAVGREASDQFTLTTLDQNTNYNDFMASQRIPASDNVLYSGSVDLTVGNELGGHIYIQMTRQLAGLTAYLSNVPTAPIAGITPQVVGITITSAENNGFGNTAVNLTTGVGSTPYLTRSITVTAVLLTNQSTGQDGTTEVFAGNVLTGVSKLNNTQLNGSFVVPTRNVSLEIVLATINNGQIDRVLRSWPIKMVSDGSTTFDLLPNHFYSIGVKNSTTNTDDDSPIDLNWVNPVTATISQTSEWFDIHDIISPFY